MPHAEPPPGMIGELHKLGRIWNGAMSPDVIARELVKRSRAGRERASGRPPAQAVSATRKAPSQRCR